MYWLLGILFVYNFIKNIYKRFVIKNAFTDYIFSEQEQLNTGDEDDQSQRTEKIIDWEELYPFKEDFVIDEDANILDKVVLKVYKD